MVCTLLIAGASLFVVQWFSCPAARGIFSDQGSNPANSLLLSRQGSPWSLSFHKLTIYLSVAVSQKLLRIFLATQRACRISAPQSGIESPYLALEDQSPNPWTIREVPARHVYKVTVLRQGLCRKLVLVLRTLILLIRKIIT